MNVNIETHTEKLNDETNQCESSIDSDESASLQEKHTFRSIVTSGYKWLCSPIRTWCKKTKAAKLSVTIDHSLLNNNYNHVNGCMKYFTFGVQFTNGMFCFAIFIVGLWSSFEQRIINRMSVAKQISHESNLNIFNHIGIALSIFGISCIILCTISSLGIIRENLTLLRISLTGQFIALIIFFVLVVTFLAVEKHLSYYISKVLMTGLTKRYHIDDTWRKILDNLQTMYQCCGVFMFGDWNDNPNFTCTSKNILISPDACAVPFTCCKTGNKTALRKKHLVVSEIFPIVCFF
ncbi:unnamed protein product [Didymodactylos carnosus]|uniref:Tetraspanin n=1 Tax=Didymodactylos carnosus TaxID=1234261 RepID=A0A813WQU4_9BILA|nr:unnamed protein product [Didymodactylos carnosus]CAF1274807.1 unnamed protein product [Didymodactylos carnosus]CAF3641976.1 unnamed protein product [Didymodactylos carnosus]CAF4079939.1 unnamed protein product [Didymodactylos carnosus]